MNEASLREVLAELGVDVKGRNGSGWLVCSCPFAPHGYHPHGQDRNPSFFVHPNPHGPSGYNCYSCHQHGTVQQLVPRLEEASGESFGNLATRVHMLELSCDFREFGQFEDEEAPLQAVNPAVYAGMYGYAWEDARARAYLESRGVPQGAAMLMGLLYDQEGMRVLFPVKGYGGELWGFSGRSIIPDGQRRNEKVKDYAGLQKRKVLLGEELVALNDSTRGRLPLLVVEGLFAFAHLVSIGARKVCNPVATMGSFTSIAQRDRLVRLDRPVTFLYDDDIAGDTGLFGRRNDAGKHEGGGALDLLKPHVPTFLAYYPDRFSEGTGDPDDLTLDDVRWIMRDGREFWA